MSQQVCVCAGASQTQCFSLSHEGSTTRRQVRDHLVLVATYPGHFGVALNLCRSMAAYANDTSLVSVRLIVGDEEEAALLLSSALNYSGGKELPLSSQLNSTGSLVPALIRGDQVASASSGPCSVPSAALDVQVIALAHAAAPFGGLGGFHYDPSSRACDNGQIRWGARPGCRPDGHKFLYQFVKKIVAARYFVSARGLLILDSESEALPRPFSMGALYREYQHRPYAFLTHRPVEHCTCAAMLGGIHVDPMASAPRDVPNESCAGHAAAGLAPPVWGAGRCVQGSLVQAEATGDVGIRTPWGYGGWFWAHAEVEALVQHVEQLHRGSFVSIAASYFYRYGRCFESTLYWMFWRMREASTLTSRRHDQVRTGGHTGGRTAGAAPLPSMGLGPSQAVAPAWSTSHATPAEPEAFAAAFAAGGASARRGAPLRLYTPHCLLSKHFPPTVARELPTPRSLEFLPLFLLSNDTSVLAGLRNLVNELRVSFVRLPPLSLPTLRLVHWLKSEGHSLMPAHLGYPHGTWYIWARSGVPYCAIFLANLRALLRACPTITFLVSLNERWPEGPLWPEGPSWCGAAAADRHADRALSARQSTQPLPHDWRDALLSEPADGTLVERVLHDPPTPAEPQAGHPPTGQPERSSMGPARQLGGPVALGTPPLAEDRGPERDQRDAKHGGLAGQRSLSSGPEAVQRLRSNDGDRGNGRAALVHREPIMEPHALQHCAWSREESAGFFCYPDHEWRLKRRIFVEALRQSAVDEHPISNMFWQNNWEPNFACAFERRPGAPGDGAKWLCDPHKLTQRHGHGHAARRSGGVAVGGTGSVDDDEATAPGAPPNTGCLLYSIGSAGNFAWELSMLELLRVCEVHTFDHTMRLGSVHPPPGVTYHYWGVGTADRWIRADKSVGVFTLNTMREMLGHANRTVDVLKVDVEGAEYGFLLPLLERDGGRGLAFAQQLLIELHYERISSHYPPRGPFLKLHSGDAAPRGDSPHVVQPPPMHHRFFWAMTRAGWAIFHKEPNTAYAMGGCLEYGFVRLDWNASALIEEAKQWWCVGGWRNEENGFLPRCQGWGSLPPGAPTTLRHLGYVSNENYGRGGQPAANVLLERDNVTGGFVLAPGQQLTAHGKGWRAHHHPAP